MNLRVNLTKRVQTDTGLRYCPAVESANGRIKPHVVVVNGQEEKHEDGAYYLEWRSGGQRKRLSVGNDPAQAQARRLRKVAELNAVANGISIAISKSTEDVDGNLRSVANAVAAFLEETKLSKKPKTFAAYQKSLGYFQESCGKLFVEDIDRLDMLKFATYLKDADLAPRTCWNKFNNTMTFLKANGIRGIVKPNDWPKFVEEEPEVYDRDDLKRLWAVCDTQERLWWDFFLMTGMREQEVMHCCWRNVNFNYRIITVQWKPEYNWTPKMYKERTVPVPEVLIHRLKAAKAKAAPACPLVFPTSGCKPKFDFLDCLKADAKRANLKPSSDWFLHKFRATFATWHLWAGIDLRTVQSWMGHTDMESTMRYLKPSRSQTTRDRVDATFA